jgi:hypothetical protein
MKQAPTGQSYSQKSDSPSTLPTRSEKEVASSVVNTPSVDRSHDVSLKSESAISPSSMDRSPVDFERNPKENLRETKPVQEEQAPPPSHPLPSPSRTPERQEEPHHSGDPLHSLKKSVSPGLTSRDLETHKNPASLNKSHEEELSTSFKKTGSKG